MSGSLADKISNAFKFIYHGAIDGLLITSGPMIYLTAFLSWPITTPFLLYPYIASTALATLVSIYYRSTENTRRTLLEMLNTEWNQIRELVAKIQYKKEKMIVEQQLLKVDLSDPSNLEKAINRTISQDNRKIIEKDIQELNRLLNRNSEKGLVSTLEEASTFKGKTYRRHALALFKSLTKAFVFYFCYPVFIVLTLKVLFAPTWFGAFALQFYVYCGLSALIGFFKPYIKERTKFREFDAAVEEASRMRDTATKIAESAWKHYKRDPVILHKIPPLRSVAASNGNLLKLNLGIKSDDKLLKRVAHLSSLPKSLGQQDYSDHLSFDLLGKYLFAIYSGALIPAGTALFLTFVLGVNVAYPATIVFGSLMVVFASVSVLYQVFNDFRLAKQEHLTHQSDKVHRLSQTVQRYLQKLKKEAVLIKLPGHEKAPFHRQIPEKDRQQITEAVSELKNEIHQLDQLSEGAETFRVRRFTRFMDALFLQFHAINTSVALHFFLEMIYYGLVFLVAGLFIDILTLSALHLTILTVVAYMLGQEITVILESQFSTINTFKEKIEDAHQINNVSEELNKHCEKYLKANPTLLSKLQTEQTYFADPKKPEIVINQESKKFPLLEALSSKNACDSSSRATDHEVSGDEFDGNSSDLLYPNPSK